MPPYENADTRPHTTNMKEMMTMKNVVKKIGMMLLTMVIVSFFAFLAFQVIPGDPTIKLLSSDATAEAVAALRAELGLDRPFFTRYFEWVLHALQGDFGTSYVYSMPVAQLLNGKLGVTALLTAIAFVLIVLVSLPVGLFAASRQGGWLDRALTVLGQVVMAVPPFVVGILLTLVCGLILHWFDPGAFIAPAQSFWSSVGYLLYPAVAIALPRIAMTVKMLRASILNQMERDYVRTARSRGSTKDRILRKHVLRNAIIPVITFIATSMAEIVASSIVIEQVFAIPGIGVLLLSSINNRDFPVVQALVMILVLWVVLVNFLADLLYQYMDPRIRLR